jgi:hypothetical protein
MEEFDYEFLNFLGLKETGNIYLVNKEKLLISNPRFGEVDLLVQEVNTENVDICFEHLEIEYLEEMHEIYNYFNYRGDLVFGTHNPIPYSEWCLIVEFEQRDFFKKIFENTVFYFIFFGFIFSIIFIYFIRIKFNKNYVWRRK